MSALLRRLRAALAPRYRVDAELGAGATSRVFLGHDPALDRPVAIKVLRPERATATAADVFLQEARTAARLSHPNVVPIHEVGREDGLFYFVMDYMEDETLRERLDDGPLPVDAAVRVAEDLLDALEAAHREGVVHGDVKPANVFLRSDRALLGDFGIARQSGPTGDGDGPVGLPSGAGTPGYMAPEQAAGRTVDARADVYAVGLVLFEALTGRLWPPFADPGTADWTGVPSPLARVLERALRVPSEERWAGAASFREALVEARHRGDRRKMGVGGAVAALLLVGAAWGLWGLTGLGPDGDAAGSGLYDLAMLPCEPVDPSDSTVALQTSRVAASALEHLPRLRTASHLRSFRWWAQRGSLDAYPDAAALETLETRVVSRCLFQILGNDSLAVDVQFVGRESDPPSPVSVRSPASRAPVELGYDVALAVFRRLNPGGVLSDESFAALSGRPWPAVRSFLLGEDAFQRDARCAAERHYSAAVESDSSFTLARWRLTDLRRYVSADPSEEELDWLSSHADELGPVDRRMLTARARPPGTGRLAEYQRALEDHPRDTYLLFTYGDELFHRGPLWGIAPDSAREVFRRAAARDSFLAPAYDHLLMTMIRAGDRDGARRALEQLTRIKQGSADPACALYDPALLGHAYRERFEPERARELRSTAFGPPGEGDPEVLAPGARFGGPYLDLAEIESFLGRRLRRSRHATSGHRVAGLVGEALGLRARGRIAESLARLDSAVVLDGGAEARLYAEEWRVVPHALGLPGTPQSAVRRGRRALETMAADDPTSALRLRARFALGLLDPGSHRVPGDAGPGASGGSSGPGVDDEAVRRASMLVAALRAARAPDPDPGRALELTRPLLAYRVPSEEPGPFFRSALYLLRGEWQRRLGRPEEAGASWLWHEAVDLTGEPSAFPQRGEVGWALGAWADARRAAVAAEDGRRAAACRASREALRHFEAPDSTLAALRRDISRIREETCDR